MREIDRIEIKVAPWSDREDFINWIKFKYPEYDIYEHSDIYDMVNGYFTHDQGFGGTYALRLMQELYEEYESDMGASRYPDQPELF